MAPRWHRADSSQASVVQIGDLMAASRQPAGEAVERAGYPSVRPGVGGIGRDVKDSQNVTLLGRASGVGLIQSYITTV